MKDGIIYIFETSTQVFIHVVQVLNDLFCNLSSLYVVGPWLGV